MAELKYTPLIPVSEWIRLDDIVKIKGQGDKLYKVTKPNPKRYCIVDEDGNNFTIAHRGVVKAPADAVFTSRVVLAEVEEGTVVHFTGNLATRAGAGPWVCIKAGRGAEKSTYARLNGSGDRMRWTAFPNSVQPVQAYTI